MSRLIACNLTESCIQEIGILEEERKTLSFFNIFPCSVKIEVDSVLSQNVRFSVQIRSVLWFWPITEGFLNSIG